MKKLALTKNQYAERCSEAVRVLVDMSNAFLFGAGLLNHM